MKQTFDEIAELAEDLGKRYLSNGKVDLEKIAKDNNIQFIEEKYENHFLGQLVHLSKKFYIILNSDLLSGSESGRIRFTIAHELGHYFIDEHRKRLANGTSLSFKGELSDEEYKQIEITANHFASHLLMPKKIFLRFIKGLEPGLECILALKERFDTSIEATTKHYIKLNVSPSIMLRWRVNYSFHYPQYSRSFSHLTRIYRSPTINFTPLYIEECTKNILLTEQGFFETVTPISKWISTIVPGSKQDIMGLEQTIRLGDFGGITLLTFY